MREFAFQYDQAIFAYELGNEVRISAREAFFLKLFQKLASGSRYTQPEAYAKDYIELIRIRNDAYKWGNRPYIFGVDDHPNGEWMAQFLKALRKNGEDIDAYTWHDYPLGQGKESASLIFINKKMKTLSVKPEKGSKSRSRNNEFNISSKY